MTVADRALQKIQAGQIIGAGWLNAHVDQTNRNTQQINAPRQSNAPAANPASTPEAFHTTTIPPNIRTEQSLEPLAILGDVWTEFARVESEYTVTNPDDPEDQLDTAEIVVIMYGNQKGQIMTLRHTVTN